MPNFVHYGLYFTAQQVQQARKYRDREPFHSAWALLAADQADPLASALWNGLRYRFADDQTAGEQTVQAIVQDVGLDFENEMLYGDVLAAGLAAAQTFELIRDHPALAPPARAQWLEQFAAHVARLNDASAECLPFEGLWLAALNVAAGIVLEDPDRFESGAAVYRQAIRDQIRPEGYILGAVEGKDGGSLYRQLRSVAALALMAEAAAHVGLDLWGYTWRGVSLATAASYLIYYYYYPDRWRWDTPIEAEAKRLFAEHGGFLEMLNRRVQPRDIKLLLDDLRPLRDITGGGLTTLTHGLPARKGRFG